MNHPFLQWLEEWHASLPKTTLTKMQADPKKIAVIIVDMIVGFCSKGPLASQDIAKITPDIISLMGKAYSFGVRNFVLLQDAHNPQAEEFNAYPPHCIKGSDEAKTIPEIAQLPFAHIFTVIEKNTLHPAYDTKFDSWVKKHPEIDTFIIAGDCTDLCVYSMAMHLRLLANSKNHKRQIVIPVNCVETYDLSVQAAKKIGALPHDRILLHKLFLYHMALNAIEIKAEIK